MRRYADLVRHGGNRSLFTAAEMSILSTRLGWPFHLHAEGVRGTGKTSILRSARDVLPRIKRIKGCLYNCAPGAAHCPEHRHLAAAEVRAAGTEWVPMPFLEVSHSAKLGTVVGTIDLAGMMQRVAPAAVMLPGTLAKAHRGIVFIDEVNRLADTAPELTDVLLDVMGTRPGRLQIEESGLPPVVLPLRVSVWAASNPDEEPGPLEDIRRQLADRFDFTIPVGRPDSPVQVRRILDRLAGSQSGAVLSAPKVPGVERRARRQQMAMLARTGRSVPGLDGDVRDLLAELYMRYDLESLRAVEAWQWAARIAAQRAGRGQVEIADLLAVAAMVLGHRVDMRVLADLLAELGQGDQARAEAFIDSAGGAVQNPVGGDGDQGRPGQDRDSRGEVGSKPVGPGAGQGGGRGRGGGQGTGSAPGGGAGPTEEPAGGYDSTVGSDWDAAGGTAVRRNADQGPAHVPGPPHRATALRFLSPRQVYYRLRDNGGEPRSAAAAVGRDSRRS